MKLFKRLLTATLLYITVCLSALSQHNIEIIPSGWSISWGAGLGAMVPTGNLGDNFSTGFAADTEVNIAYKSSFLMINGGFSTNSLANDIDVVNVSDNSSSVWPKNSNALHAFIGANIGFNFYATDHLSIYPYVGVAHGFIEPNLKTANSDENLGNLKMKSLLWNVGMGVDYNFPDKNYRPGAINRILKVGVRYQFQKPDYEKDYAQFTGATHWMTLRFVIGSTMPGRKVLK